MEIADQVKPRLVVVIGHVHDQRVPLPVTNRVAHPQLDAFADVPPPVQGNGARSVVELLEDHDGAGGLNNLKSSLPEYARDTARKTTRVRVDVLGFRELGVVIVNLLPFRPRPGLVRKFPVRRVDNHAFPVSLKVLEGRESLLDVVRIVAGLVLPESLDIRLASSAVRGEARSFVPDRRRLARRGQACVSDGTTIAAAAAITRVI